MKNFLKILTFLIAASVGFGAVSVGDVKVSQATSASPVAWKDIIITPTANSLLNFNSTGVPTAGANITFDGAMWLGAAPGGMPSAGVINAHGFKIDGVDVSTSSSSYWVADSPGIKYVAGPVSLLGTPTGAAGGMQIGNLTTTSINGNVTLGAGGPDLSSSLNSRAVAQGMAFSGVTGATIAAQPADGTAGYSKAFYLRANSLAAAQDIFDGVVSESLLCELGTNGSLLFFDRVANAAIYTLPSGTIVAGKEYHIVYARGSFYVDGVVLSTTITDASNYTSGTTKIGSNAAGTVPFNGTIRNFVPYNYALTAAQVKSLYESGVSPSDLPAVPAGTALITGDNSTFASDTGFWTPSGTVVIGSGSCTLNAGSYIVRGGLLVIGTRYRVTVTVTSGDAYFNYGAGDVLIGSGTGTHSLEFVAVAAPAVVVAVGASVWDTVTLTPIGALAAYSDTQSAPPGTTKLYDISGHGADITLGAGTSFTHPSSLTTPLGGGATIAASAAGAVTVTPTAGQAVSVNGKLQLATHTTSAGGIGFGTDTALFRTASGRLAVGRFGDATNAAYLRFAYNGGTESGSIGVQNTVMYVDSLESGGSIKFRTNNTATTALTLDSSQNAVFAGSVGATGITEHADNAAAVTAGLAVGTFYRTGDVLKVVH